MNFNEPCKYDRLSTNENDGLVQSKDSEETKASANIRLGGILLILLTCLSILLNVVLLFRQHENSGSPTYQCTSTYGQIVCFILERPWLILL